jgi:osmotically-inducible protein OsmY
MADWNVDRNRWQNRYDDEDFDRGVYGRGNDPDFDENTGGYYRDYDFDRGAYGRSFNQGGPYNRESFNRGSTRSQGNFGRGLSSSRGSNFGYNRGYNFGYGRDLDYDVDNDLDLGPTEYTYTEFWLIPGPETGHGPQGYHRSDTRIYEDVCDRLAQHGRIDARDLSVQVENGEVTLNGTVPNRNAKRMAEDVAETVIGVTDVHNHLKVGGQKEKASQQGQPSRSSHSQFESTGTASSSTFKQDQGSNQ